MKRSAGQRDDDSDLRSGEEESHDALDMVDHEAGDGDSDFDLDAALDDLLADVEDEQLRIVPDRNFRDQSPAHPEQAGNDDEIHFPEADGTHDGSRSHFHLGQITETTRRANRPETNEGIDVTPRSSHQSDSQEQGISPQVALAIIDEHRETSKDKKSKGRGGRGSRGRRPQGREKYGRFRKLRHMSSQEMLERSKAGERLLLPGPQLTKSPEYQPVGKYRQRPDKVGPYAKTRKKGSQANEDEEDSTSNPNYAPDEDCRGPTRPRKDDDEGPAGSGRGISV